MQMTAPLAQASREDRMTMIQMVNEEIYRQQYSRCAAITATEEELKQLRRSRNQRNARDLEARRASAAIRPCLADRICDGIVTGYSVLYATVYTICQLLVQRMEA